MGRFCLLLLFICALLFETRAQNEAAMKILYVYDPLCGWCYGFSPVMTKIYEKHKNNVRFEVISGGMVTGNRIGPIGEVAGYIGEAYKTVEQKTGTKFGTDFLEGTLKEGKANFTSIPPSIALTIFKEYKPEEAILFASDIQKGIYYEGKEPEMEKWYADLAARYGIKEDVFLAKFEESDYLVKARSDFKRAQELGVRGFPSVFIERNGEVTMISSGYSDFDNLDKKISQYLSKN